MLDMERRTINLVSNDDSEEGEQEDEQEEDEQDEDEQECDVVVAVAELHVY